MYKFTLLFISLRRKSRRILSDFEFDQLNFGNQKKGGDSSRFGSIKTSSEFDIVPKHWAIASEGFPPGVTVDELKKYGRRKQLSHLRPQDNLRLEEGSLKLYKSEYKRRFLPFCLPKPSLNSEENGEENKSKDVKLYSDLRNTFKKYSFGRPIVQKPQNNLFIVKNQPMESLTEKNSMYIAFPHYEKRKLLRRSTALKPEGEITSETEVRKEYVDYKNPEKAQLIRKLPSLKLEGDYEPLTTEQRDKFIAYLLSRRPILEKKKTSLKMEGNFDFLTEKKLSYIPHEFSERPRIRKRSTSLKLEGEVEFSPEYKNSFVDFPRNRPITYKPNGKIRHEGGIENQTETKTQFVNFENVSIPQSAKPENNLHIEGEMEISPEYKNNFIDFPRERPFLRKPFNHLRSEGNLELLTENSEKFYNFWDANKSNSTLKAGEPILEKNLNFPSEDKNNLRKDEKVDETEVSKMNLDSKIREMDFLVEKPQEFQINFSEPEKEGINRRPLSLKQERQFFFTPEYRKSYVNDEREKNPKLMRDIKSNSSSPRKKTLKEKLKFDFEDGLKSTSETLQRNSKIKILKEATPEKAMTKSSKENIKKLEEEKKKESSQSRQSSHFSETFPTEGLHTAKDFPAFKVLDVKGQIGCQSMIKDVLESEKSTSDEENSTYRLEVSNLGERSPGFYKNNRRMFPDLALSPKTLEEAETRAKQRAANYVKVVKSPEVPKSLLDESKDLEKRWRISERLCPLSPQENLNPRSFVILDEKRAVVPDPETSRGIIKKEKNWMPGSIDSLLA